MPCRSLLPSLLTALLGLSARVAALAADGQVYQLRSADFDSAIRSQPLTFVAFFAPWCSRCKELAPEWHRTAVLAKDLGISIAKVDAIAEKALSEKHEVESFPTLKLYRSDAKVSKPYSGERTAEKMLEWLRGCGRTRTWLRGPRVRRQPRSGPAGRRSRFWGFSQATVRMQQCVVCSRPLRLR